MNSERERSGPCCEQPACVGGRHSIVFLKGDERYVWFYRAEQYCEVARSAGQMAGNPELSLTWFDAARIAWMLRKSHAH